MQTATITEEIEVDYYEDYFGSTVLSAVTVLGVNILDYISPDKEEKIIVMIDEMED